MEPSHEAMGTADVIRFAELRALAFLRRIAIAAESFAESQRNFSFLATAEWERSHPARRKVETQISTMDVDKIEAEWRKEQAEMRELEGNRE